MGSAERAPRRVPAGALGVGALILVVGVAAGLLALIDDVREASEARSAAVASARREGARVGRSLGDLAGCVDRGAARLEGCGAEPLTCRGAAQALVQACVRALPDAPACDALPEARPATAWAQARCEARGASRSPRCAGLLGAAERGCRARLAR